MKIPIKPLCEEKWARKDGVSAIYLQWFHDGEHRIFLNTGLAIPSAYWNRKKQCVVENLPIGYGSALQLNDEIDRQLRLAQDLIKLARSQDIPQIGLYVKEKYSPGLVLDCLAHLDFNLRSAYIPEIKKKKENFFKHMDDYIASKSKRVKKGTLTVYHSMKVHLEAYENYRKEPITFASLDYQFYESFLDFLIFEYRLPRKKTPQYGLRVNTIGKTIKQFRTFINDRVKRKIIPSIDLTDWRIPAEETDAVYLSYEEIQSIYQLDLSENPDLVAFRNWLVLACLTGLRFS
ncbi:MAG TPA: site-specific integrase, partial [Puia sp.]|nr:site-specific integrase [Puia sp.]